MPKEQTVLFMTVGKGSDQPNILAHGLYTCIDQTHTDWIVFFASEESKEDMVPRIKKKYYENKNLELDHCDIVVIEKIDDFDYIFNKIKDQILKYQDTHRIFINYTSGTKTMTMTAGLISALYGKDLISVRGKRDDDGYIIAKEDCHTNKKGIFCAGDIRVKNVRQLVTATSDGAIAATEAVKYLNNL